MCPSSGAWRSRDDETRMAAVACLGSLPIDSAAAAAVAYVDDPQAPTSGNKRSARSRSATCF